MTDIDFPASIEAIRRLPNAKSAFACASPADVVSTIDRRLCSSAVRESRSSCSTFALSASFLRWYSESASADRDRRVFSISASVAAR